MPKTIISETDALDAVTPATHPAIDAVHFRRNLAARTGIADADAEVRAPVGAARDAGYSWAAISAALDTTRQAAFERFGRNKP